MKKSSYIIKLLLIGIIVVFSSCEKWITEETNIDPDSPKDVSMDLLLTSAQLNMGYVFGGFDIAGVTGMWMRYIIGNQQQAKNINDFIFNEKDVDAIWSSIYSGILKDLEIIIEKSETPERESPQYKGVAQILMAYTYGTATQLWGDIPFSQDLQGDDNLNPIYDPQEEIYNGIQLLLDEGIANVSTPDDSNYYSMDELDSDFIFDGDMEFWEKTARSLKLRYWLHLSKVQGNAAYQRVLDYYLPDTSLFINSNEGNFQFYFGDKETEANPMYQFDLYRGSASKNLFYKDIITGDALPFGLASFNLWLSGFHEGEYFAGNIYGDINSPVSFMSYDETLFIVAECQAKLGQFDDARKTLLNAEMATIDKIIGALQLTSDQYKEPYASALLAQWRFRFQELILDLDDDEIFENIINYKYISMFLNPEAFVDWRRTGIPELNDIDTTIEIPRRYPYPSEERLYNENMPREIKSIYARNWFDPE